MRRYLGLAFISALLIAAAFYLYFNRGALFTLQSVEVGDLVLVAVLLFVHAVLSGYTFYLILDFINVRISYLEMIALSFLTTFGNYLGPARSGAVLKAVYLKHRKGLAYSKFSAVLATNMLAMFCFSGVVGLFVLAGLWLSHDIVAFELVAVCVLSIFIGVLPVLISSKRFNRQGHFWSFVNLAIMGFNEICRNGLRKIWLLFLSLFLQYVVGALLAIVVYGAIGKQITVLAGLTIGVFTSISNLVSITPNNLGIQELVMAYLANINGVAFADGIVGAGLVRAVQIVLTFVLAPAFAFLILRPHELWWLTKTPSEPEAISDTTRRHEA